MPDAAKTNPSTATPNVATFERHYTPQEIAQLWKLDVSTVRRLFIDEPGVLVYGKERRRDGRRDYVTLRIPASVVVKVHERRTRRAS